MLKFSIVYTGRRNNKPQTVSKDAVSSTLQNYSLHLSGLMMLAIKKHDDDLLLPTSAMGHGSTNLPGLSAYHPGRCRRWQ
jgi:hypothetical protein